MGPRPCFEPRAVFSPSGGLSNAFSSLLFSFPRSFCFSLSYDLVEEAKALVALQGPLHPFGGQHWHLCWPSRLHWPPFPSFPSLLPPLSFSPIFSLLLSLSLISKSVRARMVRYRVFRLVPSTSCNGVQIQSSKPWMEDI